MASLKCLVQQSKGRRCIWAVYFEGILSLCLIILFPIAINDAWWKQILVKFAVQLIPEEQWSYKTESKAFILTLYPPFTANMLSMQTASNQLCNFTGKIRAFKSESIVIS